MELSDIQRKLDESLQYLSETLHGYSSSALAQLGEKGLEELIEEARTIKKTGVKIEEYGERIKEHLKTSMSAAKRHDEEAKG